MELRHLRYFVAVAEELSFTRAAKRLHMAQPPLSQQIRDLEDELAMELFERSNRTVRLTRAGAEFLGDARGILRSVDQVEERARLRARGELGRLSIRMTSGMATPEFAAAIRKFRRANPEIRLSLADQPSGAQLEALARGEIDVGFLHRPKRLPAGIRFRSLGRDPMKIGVPAQHRFAERRQLAWEDLEDEPMILIQPQIIPPDYYQELFQRCRDAGVEPQIQQYTGNLATQAWLVSAGLGIAPMSVTSTLPGYAGIRLISLPKDAPIYEYAMAWRESDDSALLRKFLGYFGEGR